jgi:hypothetical protein
MRFDDALLAEIRERLPVEEIAARYTTLKRAGAEFRGISPFNAERSPSFYVIPRKRFWHCFSSGKSGNVFDLLMEMEGLTFPQAVEECAALAGISLPERGGPRDPAAQARAAAKLEAGRRDHAARQAAKDREEARRAGNVRDMAHAIWLAAVRLPGTPGEAYLQSRGVGFGARCTTLRYHPDLEHRDPETGQVTRWPGLVAAVQAPSKRFLAIWRIFLTRSGDKAPVSPAKQGLGSYTGEGGSVWLGPPGETAHVCEGIETGLGILGMLGGVGGVQAALSTSGMVNFIPPPACKRTLIWPDGDTDRIKVDDRRGVERRTDSPGMNAARKLMARLADEKRPATIQPAPTLGRDYLDVYNASKGKLRDEHQHHETAARK